MKKRFNKKQTNILFGILGILALMGLMFGLNNYAVNTTGAAIVQQNGVSDKLISNHEGMQTSITLSRPVLKSLLNEEGRIKVAAEVVKNNDFASGLYEVYKNNYPVKLKNLEVVRERLNLENEYFKEQQPCLLRIGNNHLAYPGQELKLVLVTNLKYQRCNKDWLFAFAEHSFFDLSEGGFVCKQDSSKLFLINTESGEISTEMSNC